MRRGLFAELHRVLLLRLRRSDAINFVVAVGVVAVAPDPAAGRRRVGRHYSSVSLRAVRGRRRRASGVGDGVPFLVGRCHTANGDMTAIVVDNINLVQVGDTLKQAINKRIILLLLRQRHYTSAV